MRRFALGWIFLLLICAACSRSGPPALTLAELPEAIGKAFQSARSQLKKNGEAIAGLIRDKQFVLASIQIQALLSNQELSDDQRDVLSAAVIAVNEAMQAQAATVAPQPATPDSPQPQQPADSGASQAEAAAAAAALEHYRRTK